MDWTKLIETGPGNLVTSAPRFFDNWHAQQQRLVNRGVHVATHRIAAKRVVFEISETPTRPKKTAVVAIVLVIGCLGLLAFLLLPKASVSAPEANRNSAAGQCGDLKVSLETLEINSIDSFELANWQIVTSSVQQKIGAVVQRNFSAICNHRLVSGTMQFSNLGDEWRILTLARLEEPGQ